VQELSRVHQRYVRISDAFRSAWTFHQFVEGLRKVFPDDGPEPYEADFQSLYKRLKEISQNLNEIGAENAGAQLDEVEERLLVLHARLLAADSQISPGQLRQFFQRVKSYDDGILTQLVKFYIYTHDGEGGWSIDRLDKTDFLITKLCEEYDDRRELFVLRERSRLREVAEGLWGALGRGELSDGEISSSRAEIEALGRELRAVDSIDRLNQLGLVQRFREIKHSFGTGFFHPRLLPAIVEVNLVTKNRVQELYRKEEQRIIAEYQEIFDLERDVPHGERLRHELKQFRAAVERFESQLEGANVRLDDLATLRQQIRQLQPRLKAAAGDDTGSMVVAAAPPPEAPVAAEARPEYAYVEEQYQRLCRALEETNPSHDPKKVTLDPVVFELGLEPREVIAYRRLHGDAPCNREHETLMLRAAALRVRIVEEVEAIRSQLDDSSIDREGPLYVKARETARMGDLFLRRFEHLVSEALLDGDVTEARALTVLKMRMMRTYAGLWLMVHRA